MKEGLCAEQNADKNLLLCLLIGWLGVYASLLSAVSTAWPSVFLAKTDAGLFFRPRAGMLVSVLLSGARPTASASAASCWPAAR